MPHRNVILLGDITDHGGHVITASSTHVQGGRPVARVGDTVTCPLHGDNAIQGRSPVLIDGQPMAFEGMTTACGSHLIASQTMFNIQQSPQDSTGRYEPHWDQTVSGQPAINGSSPPTSFHPPDNL